MSDIESLLDLHAAFWERRLSQPIINVDLSMWVRFRDVPALPPEWEGKEGLRIEPPMLSPERHQPAPIIPPGQDPTRNQVAFNALFPYARVPWVAGIMGCGVEASATARTLWPTPYLDDDWHTRPNQGFAPRLEWLEKLLAFLQYVVDTYYPHRCLPCCDPICYSPSSLMIAMMGSDRFYLGLYDHPAEIKLLLDQVTDLYIHWAKSQLERIPPLHGGYCNQYGIWSPGTTIRTHEDYAINLSKQLFDQFVRPYTQRVVDAFDYPVVHTHSANPSLVEWLLELEGVKCIEVSIDPPPMGPRPEELVPLWNRVLESTCLIVTGPLSQPQLDHLVANLAPGGLCFDINLVPEEELAAAWGWATADSE